ncbi:hypothetical protein LWI29_011745 [Acer saccharum]|uniref:Nicotinate phosphoribosyltransferase n=1 Tax=Acer saccharum TaxID=4024 RepID=A0AA39TDX9_ACESA|nr:hypothetical protein LWI29_011745 [Acer saccharum]
MDAKGNGEMAAAATGERAIPVRAIAGPTNPMVTPLLTDLYQFTMFYAYWKAGKHNERSVFDLFSKESVWW